MRIKNVFVVIGCWLLVIGLVGCTVRTYSLTRDRLDQDLSGNRGYLQGSAPASESETRKFTRTTQVVEIEFGPKAKPAKVKGQPVKQESTWFKEPLVVTSDIEPVQAPAAKTAMKGYKVKKGDTLQKISREFYGTTKKWTKIYDANKDKLKAPDKIYPGQIINVPLEEKELKEPKENLK